MSRYRAMKNYDRGGNIGMQGLSKYPASLTMPEYQAGGYIEQLQKLGTSVGRRRKEYDKMLDKIADIKRKAGRAGGGGFLGGLFGSIIDKLTDAALIAAFPGASPFVLKAKDYLFDPLVTGALAKYGAEKAYGSTVKFDEGPWLKGGKERAAEYQKDVRGGFQDVGQAYGLQAFGMQAAGDVYDYMKAASTKAPGIGAHGKDVILEKPEFGVGVDASSPRAALPSFEKSMPPSGTSLGTRQIYDIWKERHPGRDVPWSTFYEQAISGDIELAGGGFVNDSLLYRTFGNKSNLY